MSAPRKSPGTEAVVGWMARCPATGGRLFAYTELTARLEGQLIYKEHGFTVEPLVVLTDSAQSSWRPIETAPKDGARIILAWDNIPSLPYHWEVGFFRSNSRRSPTESYSGWCNTYGHAFSGEPTHWMLPAPPSNQGASK